jgi:hypothetical protein
MLRNPVQCAVFPLRPCHSWTQACVLAQASLQMIDSYRNIPAEYARYTVWTLLSSSYLFKNFSTIPI